MRICSFHFNVRFCSDIELCKIIDELNVIIILTSLEALYKGSRPS